jgi:hypothetical protein
MTPGETMAREALAAWEKAAGGMSESMVRDPRVLELGASLLQLGLVWKKAMDQMVALSLPGGIPGPAPGAGK